MPLHHAQRAPSARLRPFVCTLWATEPGPGAAAGPGGTEHVLPTGSMHLVFRLGGDPVRLLPAAQAAQPLGHAVVGGARASFYAKEAGGAAASVGAQLYPGAAELLFGVPSDVLAERHTDLADLWGPRAGHALEQLQGTRTLAARLDMLEHLLAARLAPWRGLHPAVAQALRHIGEPVTVQWLVQQSGLSHRQFSAQFQRAVGLAPKAYARVLRFQRVLHGVHSRARAGAPVQWADAAQAAGYFDQPHFNREFRAMAGVTPESYRARLPAQPHHLRLP
jgi:AraC-like DNA-binding protein